MALNLDLLTEQERDLLRLLAQGHTAKTIAHSRGLSVNVVNERLRSARRKTGAVSSRELARLVAKQPSSEPQENRNRFFGVDDQVSGDHGSRPRPATGAGFGRLWGMVMIVGVLGAAGLIAYATSGAEPPAETRRRWPVPVSGGPEAAAHWRVMSSSAGSPAIVYLTPSKETPGTSIPTVVLSCRSVSLDVRVRGFTPEDAWPQPTLTTRIGAVERSGSPEVNAAGEAPALGYGFAIADEVLEPLARGEPIAFAFNGEAFDAPAIPEAIRTPFVERCADLVHPGMRRRGAASNRVY